MIVPVILAGGSGKRLWPLSRELYPKQLLKLQGAHTMLQETVLRLKSMEYIGSPIVVCNESHRFMVAEQLQAIDCVPDSILLEPVGRNTAPAIAVAALKACEHGEDPVLLILPADHLIEGLQSFGKAVKAGACHAEAGHMITFGIKPLSPETGYGYIKKGQNVDDSGDVFVLEKFVEKPELDLAREYVSSGMYCWNSGMFMFQASTVLKELDRHAPHIMHPCRELLDTGVRDLDFLRLDRETFEQVPSDSIDYAVMEKTSTALMISLDSEWSDLGSFDSLWKAGVKDHDDNVLRGDVLTHDVKTSYIHSEHSLIAAVGLDDFVIVETKDAILVAPRQRVQDVEKIVLHLKSQKRQEATTHSRVYRPWGSYETIDLSERFQVKRITVKPGAKLSLQKHYHRAEHWTVVSGSAMVTRGDEDIFLKEDESTYIPLGMLHRLENPGKIPLELIEVQSGSYLGEDDIVRFEDVYGRRNEI